MLGNVCMGLHVGVYCNSTHRNVTYTMPIDVMHSSMLTLFCGPVYRIFVAKNSAKPPCKDVYVVVFATQLRAV
jgi:hypothetical protein